MEKKERRKIWKVEGGVGRRREEEQDVGSRRKMWKGGGRFRKEQEGVRRKGEV
jgi:hypothetical protein